jgi:hypothetical protein
MEKLKFSGDYVGNEQNNIAREIQKYKYLKCKHKQEY